MEKIGGRENWNFMIGKFFNHESSKKLTENIIGGKSQVIIESSIVHISFSRWIAPVKSKWIKDAIPTSDHWLFW